MGSPQDTIAAIATPLGEGGLGVIRVSGPAALAVAQRLFRSPKNLQLETCPSHTCHVGTIASSAGAIDQAVLTLFRAPHSYTGEDVVELSAHGSPYVLQQILQACLQSGARTSEPGEFTQRAFLNGKMDLTQAEAVADLIRAKSEKSHHAALAQLQGHLASEIRALRENLLPLIAHVEVGLDHSDEDHDFLQRDRLLAQCREMQERVDTLLESARVGKILRDGLHIALVGRPNVGKSSLLNALLKEDRAIVTPIAGTTRDTLAETAHWNGLTVVLTDTAGLRDKSDDPVEQLGMGRTQAALEKADLVFGLFDGSQNFTDEDRSVLERCQSKPHLWVMTKTDLKSAWTFNPFPQDEPMLRVSAHTGEGLPALVHAVERLSGSPLAATAEWMLNARHHEALSRARQALQGAVQAAQGNALEECVALDLHTALQSLGEIIGQTPTEELLGHVFSQFCVGK